MAKIDEIKEKQIEIDGKQYYYMLRIQGIERNKMLMATVAYKGKKKTISQTPFTKEKDSRKTLEVLAELAVGELHRELKEENQSD